MSETSRILRVNEIDCLVDAQIQAATLKTYEAWLKYMRLTYTYSCVMRMALYIGCQKPTRLEFYPKMREAGQQYLKEMHPSEKPVSSIP